MNNPKISIITVVFNTKDTILQTIYSVINQEYANIEYIIIDGGSKDGTIDIIKEYENRISYWISESDRGIYDAMNKGIEQATGDYIYFLGADDCLIDENIIAKAAGYLKDDPVDVLSGRVWVVNEQFGIQTEYSNVFDLGDIYRGYCIPHQGLFVKAGILKKWLFDIKYKSSADRKMFYQLYFSPEVNFKFIEEKIAYYDDGGMSSCNIEVRTREDIDIMK
ncbi:MAG: glycosyltransferase family 2 protein, partial [Selenomonadaceae bacterium]